MITATPTKLKNGNWGARVEAPVHEGQTIEIRTRAGKRWTAKVEKIVWSNPEVSIVATRSRPRRKKARPSPYAQSYCGYPCPVTRRKCCPANGPCHDCL